MKGCPMAAFLFFCLTNTVISKYHFSKSIIKLNADMYIFWYKIC